MTAHSERAHATWSASATARNWNCSGALALGATVEHLNVESEAAGWGTACHELSEMCLNGVFDAADRIGHTIKTKSHSFDVDEEMAECAQAYVDYVRTCEVAGDPGRPTNQIFIEQRFSLAKLKPPFDAGGTCDAIIYNPDEKLLEVVDLKGGRGVVVEVAENKQLRTYALGALLANPGLDVVRVRSTIVQPRAPHKDGRIRSETFHIADLVEWTSELLIRMHASKDAFDALLHIKGDLMREAWGDKWLTAGDHCMFCPAAGVCPALAKKSMATANAFFNDAGAVELRNQPSDLDPARIAQVLDGADILQGWLNAVRALATRLAEGGTEIPGYQLVDKVGRRRWVKDVEPHNVLHALGHDITDTVVMSPAQAEKKIGAKALKDIRKVFDAMVEKPVTGRSLVSSAKTSKPAVKSKAEAFFS